MSISVEEVCDLQGKRNTVAGLNTCELVWSKGEVAETVLSESDMVGHRQGGPSGEKNGSGSSGEVHRKKERSRSVSVG